MRLMNRTENKRLSERPFLIGIAGGTSSGKSSLATRVMERVKKENAKRVVLISQESFYKDLTEDELQKAKDGGYNFDHPDAFEDIELLNTLEKLINGESVHIPAYDFLTYSKKRPGLEVQPADVILVEGILIFYDKSLREMFDMKVFIDIESDYRLARRVRTDINERKRSLVQVINQYLRFVKPSFEEFCLPTKKYADVIFPRGVDNKIAIELILQHIHDVLDTPIPSSQQHFDNRLRALYGQNPFKTTLH